VCEPECPAEAILPDTESNIEQWLELNATYSAEWPNITRKKDSPADADEHKGGRQVRQIFLGRARRRATRLQRGSGGGLRWTDQLSRYAPLVLAILRIVAGCCSWSMARKSCSASRRANMLEL
jgi:hypothetical protein